MTEVKKRPVARRTLYLAIEEAMENSVDENGTMVLRPDSSIGDLLDCIKDDWFKQAK